MSIDIECDKKYFEEEVAQNQQKRKISIILTLLCLFMMVSTMIFKSLQNTWMFVIISILLFSAVTYYFFFYTNVPHPIYIVDDNNFVLIGWTRDVHGFLVGSTYSLISEDDHEIHGEYIPFQNEKEKHNFIVLPSRNSNCIRFQKKDGGLIIGNLKLVKRTEWIEVLIGDVYTYDAENDVDRTPPNYYYAISNTK